MKNRCPIPCFKFTRNNSAYDQTPLNAQVESRKENPEGWIQEKITFDAAYGGERITAYLFLPKNVPPPYQTVIYFPGSASAFKESSKDIENYYEFPLFLSFIVRNGRAVLYPVYKGTFERRVSLPGGDPSKPDDSHLFRDYQIQLVKDFRRSVDYLESRPDIASKKLAYYGMSWGGWLGAIIPAIEDRLQTSVLVGSGFFSRHGTTGSKANQLRYPRKDSNADLEWKVRHDSFLTKHRANHCLTF